MTMLNRLDSRLGDTHNALGSFRNDFGERQRERGFQQNVYNMWMAHQQTIYLDAPSYPAYLQHLMTPYPAFPSWDSCSYNPYKPKDDVDHDEDE